MEKDDANVQLLSLSYLTESVKAKLQSLPKFSDVKSWSKTTQNVETDNPEIVYCRGFVHHLLTMDAPLEVFMLLDGDW